MSEAHLEVCLPGTSISQGHLAVQVLTATLEKRKEKAEIHYRKQQLIMLQKQADKNVGKTTDKYRGPQYPWTPDLSPTTTSFLILGLSFPSSRSKGGSPDVQMS